MFKKYKAMLKREFAGYNAGAFASDLMAGLTVTAVALPLALAFGVSCGADAAAGLIANHREGDLYRVGRHEAQRIFSLEIARSALHLACYPNIGYLHGAARLVGDASLEGHASRRCALLCMEHTERCQQKQYE